MFYVIQIIDPQIIISEESLTMKGPIAHLTISR